MKNIFLLSALFFVLFFIAIPKLGAERPCENSCVPNLFSTCAYDAGVEVKVCGGWLNYNPIPPIPPEVEE